MANENGKGQELQRINSPEQIDDYIRITTPGMWLLVAAMILLLVGFIIWGFAARLEVRETTPDGKVTTESVAPASFLTN